MTGCEKSYGVLLLLLFSRNDAYCGQHLEKKEVRLGVLTREVVRNVKNCETHNRIARVGRSERSNRA